MNSGKDDIAISIRVHDAEDFLLIREKGHNFWRFPGGLVEKSDYSLSRTIARIKQNEICLTNDNCCCVHPMDSYRIEDVMTIFFYLSVKSKIPIKPGSQIEEIKWFNPHDLDPRILMKNQLYFYEFIMGKSNSGQKKH